MPTITDPTQLTSLRQWYDINDGTSITASGGAASQVNDKSGNAFHLTQATTNARPTYDSDIGDGKGALIFEQSPNSQWMRHSGSNILGGTAVTVISLVMQETNVTSRRTYSYNQTGQQDFNSVAGFYLGVETGWPDGYRNSSQLSHSPDTSDVDADSYRIITMRWTGSQHIAYTNTTAWTAVSSSGTFDSDVFTMAADPGAGNTSYCRYREHFACNADLGDPSNTASETYAAWYYLQQKWSLGLGLGPPSGGATPTRPFRPGRAPRNLTYR